MNILFVCSMGRLRSKTAAHSLCSAVHEVDYCGTDRDADRPITLDKVEWADKIICMERCHRNKLRRRYKGQSHKIQVWDIPDDYGYMDDVLVVILRGKYEYYVGYGDNP